MNQYEHSLSLPKTAIPISKAVKVATTDGTAEAKDYRALPVSAEAHHGATFTR